MSLARISQVRVTAAHEGIAELVVTLEHANGGLSEVALDETASAELFKATAKATPEELVGLSWEPVRDALATAYNRFNTQR